MECETYRSISLMIYPDEGLKDLKEILNISYSDSHHYQKDFQHLLY